MITILRNILRTNDVDMKAMNKKYNIIFSNVYAKKDGVVKRMRN